MLKLIVTVYQRVNVIYISGSLGLLSALPPYRIMNMTTN